MNPVAVEVATVRNILTMNPVAVVIATVRN